jgi:hypothetical protein
MRRNYTIMIILIAFGISSKAQLIKTDYIGINLIPLIGKTLELGYEANIKSFISADIYAGYVFNSKLSSPYLMGSSYEFSNKSGLFLKLGTRYNLRNDIKKYAPFIGLNVVNAIAIEEGVNDPDFDDNTPNDPLNKNSYNLGIDGILGFTSPSNKLLNIDIGFQIGYILIDNLIDFHSYMPGMGVNFDNIRIQGILRIKYKI